MEPVFHHARLERYAKTMRETATEAIGSRHSERVVRLDTEMYRLTSRAVSRTLFSAPPAAAADSTAPIPAVMNGARWRMRVPGNLFPQLPLPVNCRYDRQFACMRSAAYEAAAHYRGSEADHHDVLSAVVSGAAHEDDPEHVISDQAVTLVMATAETITSTIVWMLRVLNQCPLIAQGVLGELHDELESTPSGPHDLSHYTYTQLVLAETLRLYPPDRLASRVAGRNVCWSKAHLPDGSDGLFVPCLLHRDPGSFPDPETFDPDRWNPRFQYRTPTASLCPPCCSRHRPRTRPSTPGRNGSSNPPSTAMPA
jgi:cyclooctatin synthase